MFDRDCEHLAQLIGDEAMGVPAATRAILLRELEIIDFKRQYDESCNRDLASQLNAALHPKRSTNPLAQ